MKVYELIEMLQGMDPEREVMIAHQPSWPIAETVTGVVSLEGGEDDEYDEYGEDAEAASVVWVVAGGPHHKLNPYAPREVFDVAMDGAPW